MSIVIRHIVGSVLLLALAWPALATAAISQAQLHAMQLDIWRVRANFHMYTVMAGDREYRVGLNDAIADAGRSFRELSGSADTDTEQALISSLRPLWEELETAARDNRIAEQGFTDTYAIQDVNQFATEAALLLEQYDAAEAGSGDDLSAMAVYMQRMTSEYLALAADPAGGMAAGTGASRIEFRVTVPEFDRMINEAIGRYQGDDATARALDQVQAKWRFIRESLVKFYENAVPFLVHRYTQEMVDSLNSAADRQETS